VSASYVTPGFLPLLGVTPTIGRSFAAGDIAQRVAIVSDSFWHGKLAADPNVLQRQIVLGGQPHTIVGVLPKQFSFSFDADVWLPFAMTPAQAPSPDSASASSRGWQRTSLRHNSGSCSMTSAARQRLRHAQS